MTELPHIKLSDLTQQIQDVIKQSFGTKTHWIVAEISNHKFYSNQDRHYFEFIEKEDPSKEPIAKVKGIAWRSGSQNIDLFQKNTGQAFTNGIQVLVKVKVEFTSTYGFSLILEDIDHSFTLGNLEKQRRETLQKLVAENPSFIQLIGEQYHTRNKKIQLNIVIQNIAIIGSPNSEGYNDFLHTIQQNQHKYRFSLDTYQSSVQGIEAETELINKLIAIYESKKQYDCVVIVRGGGSKSDFLVFNTYALSRAVAKFPIPIITGLGHQNDISIVDLMAHTSTKTPTKTAEFIIAHNKSFEDALIQLQSAILINTQRALSIKNQNINQLQNSILNNTRAALSIKTQNINQLQNSILNNTRATLSIKTQNINAINLIVVNKSKSIIYNQTANLLNLMNKILSKPKIITSNRNNDLVNLIANLKSFSNKYLINQRGYLGHYQSIIRLMSPDNILKKGFAIIRKDNKIIKNAESINFGSEINIEMEDYKITAKTISKTKK
ncbi:exodeoxyribonuclease VII large subunit [Emticicia sp. SJ17W-69]|uniref:exodeoxyribonuclease VII large subunit n=1 Tax=Emticicia sp. SJ17W-69 TaxID=3421657 RepID=UPI003EBB4534